VSKLFNLKQPESKPNSKASLLNEELLRKQIEADILQSVEAKMQQLQSQISLLQKERSKVSTLKTELEVKMAKLNEEKITFNASKEQELNAFEEWKKEEVAKISKLRKKSDKNVIDLNCTIKKLKEDNDSLRLEIAKLHSESKDKEVKYKAQIDRQKLNINSLTQRNNELQQSLALLQDKDNQAKDQPSKRENEVNKLIKNPDFQELKTKVKESKEVKETNKKKRSKKPMSQRKKTTKQETKNLAT